MLGEISDTSNADSKELFEKMSPVRAEQYGLKKVVFTPKVPPKGNKSKVTV